MRKTIDDFRTEYKKVTGKDPSIRWNKGILKKKITDAEILRAGYAAKEHSESLPDSSGDIKPGFEVLASEEHIEEPVVEPVDRRGGFREGSGRPTGQSDERARVERILELEVPDLCVKKFVQGLNLILKKFTPAGFEPDQVERIALGITLPLYYWLPSIEGASNPFVLHLQALEYIGGPVMKRAETINIIIQQNKKETQNVEEKQQPEIQQAPAAEPNPAVKKSPVKARSAAKRRK